MNEDTISMDDMWALIEEEPDILSDACKKDEALYAVAACPSCYERGAERVPEKIRAVETPDGTHIVSPFSPSQPLPKSHAKCRACNTEFDPITGVIRKPPSNPG